MASYTTMTSIDTYQREKTFAQERFRLATTNRVTGYHATRATYHHSQIDVSSMKAFLALILVLGVPSFTWWFCLKLSELFSPYEYGFVGTGADFEARKHKRKEYVEYRFKGSLKWYKADYFAETFRTEKQFA